MADVEEKMIWVDIYGMQGGATSCPLSEIKKAWICNYTHKCFNDKIPIGCQQNSKQYPSIVNFLKQIPLDMREQRVHDMIFVPFIPNYLHQIPFMPNYPQKIPLVYHNIYCHCDVRDGAGHLMFPTFWMSDIRHYLLPFMDSGVSPDYVIEQAKLALEKYKEIAEQFIPPANVFFDKLSYIDILKKALETYVIKPAIDFKTKKEFETKQAEEQINREEQLYKEKYLFLLEKIQSMISEQRELFLQDKLTKTRIQQQRFDE